MGDLRLMHSPRQSTLCKSPGKETSQCFCKSPQDLASSYTDSNHHPNPLSRAGVPAAVSQQQQRQTPSQNPRGQHSTSVGWMSLDSPRSGQYNAWHFQHHSGEEVWKPEESQGCAATAADGAGRQHQELLREVQRHRAPHRALLLPDLKQGLLKPKAQARISPAPKHREFMTCCGAHPKSAAQGQNPRPRHQNQSYPHQDVSAQHSCLPAGLFPSLLFLPAKEKTVPALKSWPQALILQLHTTQLPRSCFSASWVSFKTSLPAKSGF